MLAELRSNMSAGMVTIVVSSHLGSAGRSSGGSGTVLVIASLGVLFVPRGGMAIMSPDNSVSLPCRRLSNRSFALVV